MTCIVAGLATAMPAWAHRTATAQALSAGAISIPNLSHGQMAVMADNEAASLDLAGRQIETDPTMRRLEGFINLQSFFCMWGLVPGSLKDEASPFNECTHAYLAAARALLIHLETMPGNRGSVHALVGKIENEMAINSASLMLCRYSDEPFNTAEVIGPHWREIVFHPPTIMTFAGLLLMVTACAWLLATWYHGSDRSETARSSGRTW